MSKCLWRLCLQKKCKSFRVDPAFSRRHGDENIGGVLFALFPEGQTVSAAFYVEILRKNRVCRMSTILYDREAALKPF